jgi:hypothetical protein
VSSAKQQTNVQPRLKEAFNTEGVKLLKERQKAGALG